MIYKNTKDGDKDEILEALENIEKAKTPKS